MIRFEDKGDLIRLLSAWRWDAYNGSSPSESTRRSNVRGTSVLLDYQKPVEVLKFNLGVSGNTGGNNRFFSTALGNTFTAGIPEGVVDEDTASITLDDCFDFYIMPSAACENEDTELLTDASFTFNVTGGKEGSPDSLKGTYTYELTADGERVGSKYAGYSYRIEDANRN